VEKQIFNLITPEKTLLGAIKVYRVLEALPAYQKDDSYIFIRLSSLLRIEIQKRIIDGFGSLGSHHLFVIECNSGTEDV
jgi:hypothetical protein